MARRLAGQSIGVVLSGGGARGFAHLGVLAELERAQVAIDRVGGTSMGALIGGLIATGISAAEATALIREEFVERNPLNDFTLPLVAVTRGRKGEGMLERLFGGRLIEELELDFFCVSCDVMHNEVVIHRDGSLIESVGASVALPGYVPPVMIGGRLLIDGGVLNNLPVQWMDRIEGPVIAVNVSGGAQHYDGTIRLRRRPRIERMVKLVRLVVTGASAPRPNLVETIARSVALGSADADLEAERHADLVIAPPVSGVDMLDWHKLDKMHSTGAQVARQALADWERPPAGAATT
jgi:predicted acylesterase/phospholipase RssA